MAATLLGTTMYLWGVTAETGLVLQSFSRNVGSKEKPVPDEDGETTAKAVYDLSATYNLSGYLKTSAITGASANAPGTLITIANLSTGQGVTTGGVYVQSQALNFQNEDFAQITITAIQHPLIA